MVQLLHLGAVDFNGQARKYFSGLSLLDMHPKSSEQNTKVEGISKGESPASWKYQEDGPSVHIYRSVCVSVLVRV